MVGPLLDVDQIRMHRISTLCDDGPSPCCYRLRRLYLRATRGVNPFLRRDHDLKTGIEVSPAGLPAVCTAFPQPMARHKTSEQA